MRIKICITVFGKEMEMIASFFEFSNADDEVRLIGRANLDNLFCRDILVKLFKVVIWHENKIDMNKSLSVWVNLLTKIC